MAQGPLKVERNRVTMQKTYLMTMKPSDRWQGITLIDDAQAVRKDQYPKPPIGWLCGHPMGTEHREWSGENNQCEYTYDLSSKKKKKLQGHITQP